VLHDKSQYEVLFAKDPNYGFLKSFRCACFLLFVATFADKLSPRFVPCLFLGYATHYKGYLRLDRISNCVYISYHVYFHKNEFPFSSLTP